MEVGVSAREFSPEMVLPVNENDPAGGDVKKGPCSFRGRACSLELRVISARDFTLAEAVPVNENDPRGGDVWAL